MTTKVKSFTLHNDRGQSVAATELLQWKDELNHPSGIFGPVEKYSWFVNGVSYESERTAYLRVLPDAEGFIAFEAGWKPDNCLLLDAYGKERMRLTVPRHLTGGLVDPSYETGEATFINVSEPYRNPRTGIQGQFGVTAYVEGGKFYFELDYHTGEFLWCRQIMD